MLFSYRWLKELSGTNKSPHAVAELLMTHAFEVETVTPYAHELDDIVIGQVLSVKPHPNADRLRVTTVLLGRKDIRTIVCGAPNVAVDQRVAVVLPGGRLPGGHLIEVAELRGQKSEGMICSAKELGLGDDHTGILVLPTEAPVGKSFAKYAGLDDTVLDVKILPDRAGDVLSYRGLAREIAALEGITPAFETLKPIRFRSGISTLVPKVTLKSGACGRYILAVFKNLRPSETPLLLRSRLVVSGIRPINPVVDITNYLMLETGQPLHAFDLDAIGKGGIVVRDAMGREHLSLLDGTKVALTKEDLVIADGRRPLALAGIMGGKHSGITEKTKRVAIEIAHFDASRIRKSRKRLNLETDASYHFERGIDMERPSVTLPLLTRLMEDVCHTDFVGRRDVYPRKVKPVSVRCQETEVEELLGIKVPLFEMVQYLALLGLEVKKVANKKEIVVTVPPRRSDLREREDLIEEIGRMKGYAKIIARAPEVPLSPVRDTEKRSFDKLLRSLLSSFGVDEVLSYSFYSEKDAEIFGLREEKPLRVANPMNPDQAFMRASLIPNLLRITKRNLRYAKEFSFYEIGNVFVAGKNAPEERTELGWITVSTGDEREGFFLLKGKIEALFQSLGIKATFEVPISGINFLTSGAMAVIRSGELEIGCVGLLQKGVARSFGLGTQRVFVVQFAFDLLAGLTHVKREMETLPRFPFAYRDISLTGKKSLMFREVQSLIESAGQPLLRQVQLFDVYRTSDETSYAFHLTFGHRDRTLTNDETEALFTKIVTQAEERLGMRLRLL